MPEEASLCVCLYAFSSHPVLPGAWSRSMDFVDQSYLLYRLGLAMTWREMIIKVGVEAEAAE